MTEGPAALWRRWRLPILVLLGFLVGVGLGLLFGWVIWPVRWYNTDPADLRVEHQKDYVLMVADSLAVNGDVELAKRRLLLLTDEDTGWDQVGSFVWALAKEREKAGDRAMAIRLETLAQKVGLPSSGPPFAPPKKKLGMPGSWLLLLLGFGVFLIVLALLLWAVLRFVRQKEQAQEEEWSPSLWEDLGEEEEEEFEEEAFPYPEESLPPQALSFEEESPTLEEGEPLEEEKPLEPLEIIEEEPEEEQRPVASEETRGPAEQVREDIPPDALGVFEAEYQYGDDDFDLAFTIEAAGEFLGECGLSVCDVLEVPEEGGQKVDAFEVWLFDKDDVETVSKVLVSPYVYQDEALNVELGARGELVVAQPGTTFSLETKNLQLSVTVEEAEYLQDEEMPESAFAKLRVEFLVERANGLT